MSKPDSGSEVSDSEAEENYDPYYDNSSEVSDSEAEASDDMPEAESVVNFFGVLPPVRAAKPKAKPKTETKVGEEGDKRKTKEDVDAEKKKKKDKKKSRRRRRAKRQFEEMQRRARAEQEAKDVQHGDATEAVKASTQAPAVTTTPTAAKTVTVVYRPCETCGKDGIKKCAACKKAYYCSYNCQSKDWKLRHKQVCKVLALTA